MNFTDPMPYKCAEYSHLGMFLAIVKQNELTIFNSENFTTEFHFVFNELITSVKWSPDDNFIMASTSKTSEVHLRCLNKLVTENQQDDWAGRIFDQLGGIEVACWAPDSR